jgi:hypothetical protein
MTASSSSVGASTRTAARRNLSVSSSVTSSERHRARGLDHRPRHLDELGLRLGRDRELTFELGDPFGFRDQVRHARERASVAVDAVLGRDEDRAGVLQPGAAEAVARLDRSQRLDAVEGLLSPCELGGALLEVDLELAAQRGDRPQLGEPSLGMETELVEGVSSAMLKPASIAAARRASRVGDRARRPDWDRCAGCAARSTSSTSPTIAGGGEDLVRGDRAAPELRVRLELAP